MSNVTYQVCEMNVVRETYTSENDAIAAAERMGSELASVVMVVVDGSDRTMTTVWPVVRETYSF